MVHLERKEKLSVYIYIDTIYIYNLINSCNDPLSKSSTNKIWYIGVFPNTTVDIAIRIEFWNNFQSCNFLSRGKRTSSVRVNKYFIRATISQSSIRHPKRNFPLEKKPIFENFFQRYRKSDANVSRVYKKCILRTMFSLIFMEKCQRWKKLSRLIFRVSILRKLKRPLCLERNFVVTLRSKIPRNSIIFRVENQRRSTWLGRACTGYPAAVTSNAMNRSRKYTETMERVRVRSNGVSQARDSSGSFHYPVQRYCNDYDCSIIRECRTVINVAPVPRRLKPIPSLCCPFRYLTCSWSINVCNLTVSLISLVSTPTGSWQYLNEISNTYLRIKKNLFGILSLPYIHRQE